MMSSHVILCGLGRVGRRVLDYLQAAGVAVVAIDSHVTPAEEASTGNARFLRGDFRKRELLDQAGLAEARGVLILTSDDLVNLSTLMIVLHARPRLRVVIRMFNPALVSRLGEVAANTFALSTSALTAPMLALIAHTSGALATFTLGEDRHLFVTEWRVPAGHVIAGLALADVKRDHGVDIVAHGPGPGPRRFFASLVEDTIVRTDDFLVVSGPAEMVQRLTGIDEVNISQLGWEASLRRFGRMARKMIAEIDLPVRICTSILVAVIVTSILVFHFGMKNDTLIDAFYRTISLMATGADMRGDDAEPGSWQKAFISGLRLVGAALTAAFTAILTNYLVRAQFGGVLEVRRIPEHGHVVITGLGNVSYRALQELRRLDEEVVAIERSPVNTFIATARKLGAVVIVGDALIDEVLKRANVSGAKAIVVATDNELVNLEIALLVRELHPNKRLLVRLIDPKLAELLREAANIHLALSIPELAAPAFLAAFLGDHIRTVFLASGKLVAVIDISVNREDALVGQSVAVWAKQYCVLPLAITVGERRIDRDLAEQPLSAGAVLTAIVTFQDIHRLLERGTTKK